MAFQNEELIWTLDSKTQISSYIAQFEFRCKNFCINPIYQDIKQIGKYVKVFKTFIYLSKLGISCFKVENKALYACFQSNRNENQNSKPVME